MTRTDSGPDFADRPPWTRPGFIAAAVLLALVVAAGVAIALLPSPNDHPTAGPTTPPAATGTPGTDATGTPNGATAPTDVPTVAPGDVTWQLVGQEAVPVSASAGPRRVNGGTASGYA